MSKMSNELRITGPRFREKRPCVHACYKHSMKLMYVWPTTAGTMTVEEMSKHSGVKVMTIYTRLDRYGWDDPDVLKKESLKHPGRPIGATTSRDKERVDNIKVGSWEAANL